MKIDYTYQTTSLITKYLNEIEVAKQLIELLPQLPHIQANLLRKSLLKSSLFSARIEGNRLKLKDVENGRFSRDKEKIEVFNILKALQRLYNNDFAKKLSTATILQMHEIIMKNLSSSAGLVRNQPTAIFNEAGIAVYMPPPPNEIPVLLEKLIMLVNAQKEPPPLKAALSHFAFEKIHPFLDGNGRVGRLLATYILHTGGFGFRGIVPLEEYLEQNRQTYYSLLANPSLDITVFIEFFLTALTKSAHIAIESIKNREEEKPEDNLLPRRAEILAIIRDHQMVSFDFIKRRFPIIPESTLHFDLTQLTKKGFVKKLGNTRGAVYTIT